MKGERARGTGLSRGPPPLVTNSSRLRCCGPSVRRFAEHLAPTVRALL
jgi:hypothetical protein